MHMNEARSLKDRSEGVGSALEPRALTALGVEFGSLHYKMYPGLYIKITIKCNEPLFGPGRQTAEKHPSNQQ